MAEAMDGSGSKKRNDGSASKRWIIRRWIGKQVIDQGAFKEGAMDGASDRS
jgi:hypothetical protein